jgi:hypothetical protein
MKRSQSVPPARQRQETAGDRLIWWAATVSVVLVTVIAAVISYGHARELVVRYGVTGMTADAMPLTVDGLVATCSLVIVDCARHDRHAPWHAWALLITGACATVAANVAAGLSHGAVGAIIAGWPALVACGCFELLIRQRKITRTPGVEPEPVPSPSADPALDEARKLYAARLAAGRPPSIRDIKHDLHVGSSRAGTIKGALAVLPEPARQAA